MAEPHAPIENAAPTGRSQVLVVGASFAGLASAIWLQRLGYQVTIIEVADGLRKGGTPVDIEGETIGHLARMGLIGAVRGKVLPPRAFQFKDANDRTMGTVARQEGAGEESEQHYEIHRDDLLEILATELESSAQVTFGRSIERLEQHADGVKVAFNDGSGGDYDLVLGCDGSRSSVRRLAFGEDSRFFHFMGGYFFIKVVPVTDLLPANVSQVFSVAGRTAMLNGYDDRTDVVLAFRSAREIDYGHRNRALQRRMIHDHFDGLGWKIPAMLEHLDADDDFYFDRINQTRMPVWSEGRVALVGDASYCVSPVAGMGGSMALIGATRLADALQSHRGDHAAAFRAYEDELRPFVEEVQARAVGPGMAMMFPADEAELAERDRKLSDGSVNL